MEGMIKKKKKLVESRKEKLSTSDDRAKEKGRKRLEGKEREKNAKKISRYRLTMKARLSRK